MGYEPVGRRSWRSWRSWRLGGDFASDQSGGTIAVCTNLRSSMRVVHQRRGPLPRTPGSADPWGVNGYKSLFSHPTQCSTPFGITEVGTRRPPSRSAHDPCAQRLSASQRWAPTRSRSPPLRPGVLNAFRHHRGGHSTRCRPGRCRAAGAQRLSASQRWAPPLEASGKSAACGAQRLSASQRWALLRALSL